MKIAVTAANGQLGSAIVNALIQEIGTENIVAIARTPKKAEHLGVEVRKGDYNSQEDFNVALQGVDRVLIVSGMDAPENRIGQHQNIIEAAKHNGLEKIVYTSIVGDAEKSTFSPIVRSNRQTEEDVKASGLNWTIGRNGIYIEPDLDYLDTYIKEGEIRNCASDGKCGYTSRHELGYAYAQMLLNDVHNGNTYNLMGTAITQSELANQINEVYGTQLRFNNVTTEAYEAERKAELGEFLGTVIAGIYSSMASGAYDIPSDFQQAAGRPHKSLLEIMNAYKNNP